MLPCRERMPARKKNGSKARRHQRTVERQRRCRDDALYAECRLDPATVEGQAKLALPALAPASAAVPRSAPTCALL